MASTTGDNLTSLEGDMLAVDQNAVADSSATAAVVANGSIPNETPSTEENESHPGPGGEDDDSGKGSAIPTTPGHSHPPASVTPQIDTDVVVVGAGFSGISAIYRLRKLGLKIQAFEAGSDFGGVWYWNRYPGARVDSETPFYQLNIPEVWRTWNFSKRFPDHIELRRYFAHIDATLNLRKDVEFNARVIDASYNAQRGRWTVQTDAGHTATAKYLILATGLLHRRFIPDFPGLDRYQGEVHHSGFWPDGVDVRGKKVALIGAGATAVQITQELGKQADQLTVFLRRPSYCLPMQQRAWSKLENLGWKPYLERLFKQGRLSRAGMPNEGQPCGVFDVTQEEREKYFEELWARGAFNFQMCNYNNVLLDKKANREVYNFWLKKTRQRISDPVKRDIMAPLEPPYFFGTKRNPLEHDYYEVIDQPNVEIVDLNKTPLETFDQTGMIMTDKKREFDMVVLATGFDSFTGSLTNMGLKNKDGVDIKDVWKDGIWTYLGMMCSGFPNMFMTYSPQAPTALSNGPTILECQVDFVVDSIAKLERENIKSIEPLHSAEVEWKQLITTMNDRTLFPFTSSWWTGGNIPGKKAEPMTYIGGIDNYEKQCRATMENWKGFAVVKEDEEAQDGEKEEEKGGIKKEEEKGDIKKEQDKAVIKKNDGKKELEKEEDENIKSGFVHVETVSVSAVEVHA
ncbi:hypothetical protein A1O3_04440 [Capronia epimyces CBS 606.96]|uniref:FAD/NAD(P)-binding domain-containing protein n=1 Tax=Capronia epimyces CBS 606.96 TaxID=1182542 RepID=W9YCU6_9EURO|nr:uncharacterized protein A1O3_04440 [Capronia epimyces CBS 606.96]EXJ87480.1 hypothetical protein A1O3_04440 [Capronia epimyces CBS 606.96]